MIRLRPYQEKLKAEIYTAWASGCKNVLAVMPTGLGKTKLFCDIAIDQAVTPHNKMPTAILVHRKELVQQISLTLAEEGVMHNIIAPKPTITGIVGAQRKLYNKQYYNYMSPISVLSVDTLNSRITQHHKWAHSVGLWITDEAAHLLRENKWGRATSFFPNAFGLGVTATPQRLDKRGLGRHADGVFDTMVEGPTTKWGIANGFLSKYKIAVPKSDYQAYLRKAGHDADYTREAMIDASGKSKIIGDVVENYIKFASGKQAILFATDITTAAAMCDKFNKASIKAMYLTGESSDVDRLEGMIGFRDKKIKVLINVDLFDEGLDVPGIDCVIMARPTMSLSKYKQMVGRGLRPAPGKDHLIIIDHVGNVSEHGLPCETVKWSLDRGVKRQSKTNLIRICWNHLCSAPYDRALVACPWCGTEAGKMQRGPNEGRVPPEQVDGDLFLIDPETLQQMEAMTKLEDPGALAQRVQQAAGADAGVRAMKNQAVRIATQKELAAIIAKWAGWQRQQGYSDREIHKLFYLKYEMTITFALSGTREEMQNTIDELQGEIRWVS